MKILHIVTASVALVHFHKVNQALSKPGKEVHSIFTERALEFSSELEKKYQDQRWCHREFFPSFSQEVKEYVDNGKVLHIQSSQDYDLAVIAPASADFIAKLANGIASEPVLDILAAMMGRGKPIWIAPAMNTFMWSSPICQKNLKTLEEAGVKIIYPTVKPLACGDFGIGGMAHAHTIGNLVSGTVWWNPFRTTKNNNTLSLPTWEEPGSFGALRKLDIHTGVDLYCKKGASVFPVEPGKVVSIGPFTGKKTGTEWWNDTEYLAVEGNSGVVVYGEIEVNQELRVGNPVYHDTKLGKVLTVLKHKPRTAIRNHSMSMLHLELYRSFFFGDEICQVWTDASKRDKNLLDPTPYLWLMKK